MNNFQPLPPHEGELYVELLIGGYIKYSPWTGEAVFPARVDEETRGDWARPRFRREVAEQIATWYAELVPEDPVSVDSWRFDDQIPAHWRTMAGVSRVELRPDENGLYPLGEGLWPWFLSAPSTPESDTALLADQQRLVPQPREALVTIGIDGHEPHLPALVADFRWNGSAIPRFRREVAEVVAAWTNDVYRKYPDGSERAYWAGDDIVLVEPNLYGGRACIAERVGPDDDRRYAIGAFRWTWELVEEQ
jgi:hypothetical protein